ncbi:hypothetical protein TWF751_006928 [Orbilia oligospora]|nr:hypothetical protein TWF751_006928 [Orbilia oligospora]
MVSDLRGCTAGETHVVILGLKTPGNNNTRLYHHLPPTHPIRDHSPPCVTPIILTTTDSDPLLTAVDEILILICVYVYVYLYVSAPCNTTVSFGIKSASQYLNLTQISNLQDKYRC